MYFGRLLKQVVIQEAANGYTDFAGYTYESPIPYNARIDGEITLVRTATGEERVSKVTVLLAGDVTISPKDRWTLPEGYDPQQPPMLAFEKMQDRHGNVVATTLFF